MKKVWALLLCLLLILQLAGAPAKAAGGDVYFTAVGSSVLPLSDSTMPFWSNGYLYIPSNMFTDNVWRTLGVSAIHTDREKLILHSMGRPLIFARGESYATDSNGNRYSPGSVERGGKTFVPAYLVAEFFDLQYSVISVPRGHLVWLRKPGFGLTDRYFADAAYSNMERAYSVYQREKEKKEEPDAPQPVEPDNPTVLPSAKRIYLCLEADEQSGALLDELSRRRSGAAFFCNLEFLQQQGDLLRRMAAEGHSIGILAEAGHPEYTIEQQLALGNEALEAATCGKTRLTYLRGGSEEDKRAAESEGFFCLRPRLDRGGYALKSFSNAETLMKKVESKRGNVTVWLGDSVDSVGLRAFIQAAERTEGHCLPFNETAG